jgi:hypothetical protein
MSAVAARKAALAASMAAEGARPSPAQTPPPVLSLTQPVNNMEGEIPTASSSRAITPNGKPKKKALSKRNNRDVQVKGMQGDKTAEKRYYDEESGEQPQGKGKRVVRAHEQVEPDMPATTAGSPLAVEEEFISQSETGEEIDFSALEMLQTITNGRPKKKRRMSRLGNLPFLKSEHAF